MIGFQFSGFDPNQQGKTGFEQLLDIFTQLLTYTNGDVSEAMQWMNELDKQYNLSTDSYGMGDFYEDLKDKGYIKEDEQNGTIKITPKMNRKIKFKTPS